MTKYTVRKYTCNKCGKHDLRGGLASYSVPGTISQEEIRSYQKTIDCVFCGHNEFIITTATDEEIINSGKRYFGVAVGAKNEHRELIKMRKELTRRRQTKK